MGRFYEHFAFDPSPADPLLPFLLVKEIVRLLMQQSCDGGGCWENARLQTPELERDALGRDTGPGLTDLGKELIDACNLLRILIDLSHLNERGFWDVAAISNAPLVATHSNDEVTAKYRAWVVRQYFTSGVVG